MESGEQSATTDGADKMQKSSVNSWDSIPQVGLSIVMQYIPSVMR